jgi:cathepsin A (carboxypeptidase C)
VGFSINKDPNYQYNDSRSAQDSLAALAVWFKKFPEFSANKFWLSGESYCGMYTPLFADQILKNKGKILPDGSDINFKGMLIGNGVMLTALHWRRQARNTYYNNHYFFSPEIQGLIENCRYTSEDDTNLLCRLGNKLADQVEL